MKKYAFNNSRLVQNNAELETLLNIERMFLEDNKGEDYTKFLPTILFNVTKEGLLSEEFLLKWFKGEIEEIDKNFFFNANRDAEFKKAVQPYVESLEDSEDDEEDNSWCLCFDSDLLSISILRAFLENSDFQTKEMILCLERDTCHPLKYTDFLCKVRKKKIVWRIESTLANWTRRMNRKNSHQTRYFLRSKWLGLIFSERNDKLSKHLFWIRDALGE